MISKDALGLLSIFICVIQYSPNIYLTLKGDKRPHVFSRVIWAIVFIVTAATQYAGGGGAGSWSNWASGFFVIILALAALRREKSYITRSDWAFFVAALSTIPVWVVTKDPFYAALLATLIDLFAYIPMIRKCWKNPHDEMIWGCVMSVTKQIMSIAAMEYYSPTTLIYPLCIFVAEALSIPFLYWRRKVLQNDPA